MLLFPAPYRGIQRSSHHENGDKYEGEFVDGKYTSKGTFTCSNGKQFTGNLENKVPPEFTIRCN
jgi:hypothetical protein